MLMACTFSMVGSATESLCSFDSPDTNHPVVLNTSRDSDNTKLQEDFEVGAGQYLFSDDGSPKEVHAYVFFSSLYEHYHYISE